MELERPERMNRGYSDFHGFCQLCESLFDTLLLSGRNQKLQEDAAQSSPLFLPMQPGYGDPAPV